RHGLNAQRAHGGRRLLRATGIEVIDDDMRATPRELIRDGPANALGATGNQGYAPRCGRSGFAGGRGRLGGVNGHVKVSCVSAISRGVYRGRPWKVLATLKTSCN